MGRPDTGAGGMTATDTRRANSCTGKKPYTRWAHARNDALAVHRKDGWPTGVYRCHFCGA